MLRADVGRPRDATHCQYCRKAMEEGEFCMRSSKPVNRRRPFKYRARVAHWLCYEKETARMWKRLSKRRRATQ